MAANSSLGAALGGEGDAERLPGRPLPALVLDRLGYPGAGAPRLVSMAWRREADRLFGREREIQLALEGPHDELLAHFLNRAVRAKDVDAVRRLLAAGGTGGARGSASSADAIPLSPRSARSSRTRTAARAAGGAESTRPPGTPSPGPPSFPAKSRPSSSATSRPFARED